MLVAVWNALAGQTNIEVRRYVIAISIAAADQQRDEDLGDDSRKPSQPMPMNEDREDHDRQVDARVVDARRHVSVRAVAESERAGEGCVARRPRTRSRE